MPDPRAWLVLPALALAACGGGASEEETTTYLRTALDLAERFDAVEVLSEREDAPVKVGMLSPGNRMRGVVDKASLVLPPPAEVAFTVPDEPGELFLDLSFAAEKTVGEEGAVRVELEVLVDGEVAYQAARGYWPAMTQEDRDWVAPEREGGLPVTAGARVVFRTRVAENRAGGDPILPLGVGHPRVLASAPRARGPADEDRPNVVLIVMDTLRRDGLTCYGGAPGASPRLDALAARGVRYDRAYATSNWTWPSTASMLTGLLPAEHGVESSRSCWLANDLVTIGEVFQGAGYATAAFAGNPLIHSSGNYHQGFDEFGDPPGGFQKSDGVVPPALDWLRANAGERFFLYLHLVDTHYPYEPSDEARERLVGPRPEFETAPQGMLHLQQRLEQDARRSASGDPDPDAAVERAQVDWLAALYRGTVADADAWVGQVLDELEAQGVLDDTLVVFTADHGEQFLEHGYLGHGYTLHGEETLVPLIAAGPGLPAGRVVATPVSNRHLAPTLAGRVGERLPDVLDPLDLFADDVPAREVVLTTDHGHRYGKRHTMIGLVEGDLVLSVALESGAEGADERWLHDLAADPDATRDLASERAADVERLEAALRARLERAADRRVGALLGAGDGTLDLLDDIGYGADD